MAAPDPPESSAAPRSEVLVLVKGLGLGGAERLLTDQAISSGSRWRYAVAFVRSDKTHFVPELTAAGVPAISLSEGQGPWPLALARVLRARRPAVVHAHSPLPAAVARILVRLGVAGRGAVMVTTEHNRWSAYRWPTRILNALTMVLDHRTLAVSAESRASVRPAVLRRRVTTVVHGVDPAATRNAAADTSGVPSRSPDDFVVVHVANGRPEKAHPVLLDAFDRAADTDPNLVLWLVGQHLDRPEITAALAAVRHQNRLQVLGYRSDAPALIAAADVLVLSSDHEGLPVAVMEALTVGTPVVSTAVGGIPEAIDHEVEGLLVPPRSPQALADALCRVHAEDGLLARLQAGASTRAAAFDGSRAQDIIESAYDDASLGRRR